MKIRVYSRGETVITADPGYQEAPVRSVLVKAAAGGAHPGWVAENILIATDAARSGISHDHYAVVTEDDGTVLWSGWLTGDPEAEPPAEAGARKLVYLPEFDNCAGTPGCGNQRVIFKWYGDQIACPRCYENVFGGKPDPELIVTVPGLPAAPAQPQDTPRPSYYRNLKKLAIALDALREIRDGKTSGDFARECVGEALDRIAAIGPSFADVLPGDDEADGCECGSPACRRSAPYKYEDGDL